MPEAHAAYVAQVKYAWQDHDTAYLNQAPPVQNTWYEVFHNYDVRLLWCAFAQLNDETALKDVEMRWTIDGNVYFVAQASAEHNLQYYVNRNKYASAVGTEGLTSGNTVYNAAQYVDKRGLDFKVEIRLTSAVGTNQILRAWCVYETLEAT